VQAVRKPEQPVGLARVRLIENIAGIYLDPADEGSGGLEFLIARQIRGTRLLDLGVLLIGELRGK
jgi:hypothetical protein